MLNIGQTRDSILSLYGVNSVEVETNFSIIPVTSVCYIVDGGDNDEIALRIFRDLPPVFGTYGDIIVSVRAPGGDYFINFSRPHSEASTHITSADYPNICPFCKSPAYISCITGTVDCSGCGKK